MHSVDGLLDEHLAKAWASLRKYDLTGAMEHARAASAMAPDSPEVAHVLGLIASRDERPDLALPLLQKALEGGVSERRLRDMAEALMTAGHPQAALAPIQDAIRMFGETSESLGMLAAVQVALESYDEAAASATRAIAMKPNLLAWEGTLAFCDLIRGRYVPGFLAFTCRSQNLPEGSRCPTLQFAEPGDLWLRNEQGPGDTIFFLCHAAELAKRGWRLHVQSHIRTQKLLQDTGLFASVTLGFECPNDGFWINIGDLPLAASQLGLPAQMPPLRFQPEEKLILKIRKLLEKFGPGPYVAVTWRGGVQGKKLRAGVRMGDRYIDARKLGETLAGVPATVVSIQRVPDPKEAAAFEAGLGRKCLDLSRLNNNLPEMLALLEIVDEYVAVPNTNHHLREALGKPSQIVVNRPYEDWRWAAEGNAPWYPGATCYRQTLDGDLSGVFRDIGQTLQRKFGSKVAAPAKPANPAKTAVNAVVNEDPLLPLLLTGWDAVSRNDIPAAIQIAQQVLAQNPKYAPAYHLLGWSAMRDLKLELAASVLQQAVNLDPHDGRIVGDFIRCLTANEQAQQALEIANGALQDHALMHRSSVLYGRAAIHLKLNHLPEAIADYQECIKTNPNRLDAQEYSGLARLKLGDARAGFRESTARKVAQRPELLNDWCCPVLRPEHKGSRVLIKRDMGLGDELTYLRYLPWLTAAGIEVDYWAGKKLVPVLERMGYLHKVYPDNAPPPDASAYDLSFIVNDLPVAVEQLDAPEIAPPLPLTPRADLVDKWKAWLQSLGEGPYIGLTWKAGVGVQGAGNMFGKLAKAVDVDQFAEALSPVRATWISLQRNVLADEMQVFQKKIGAPVHDAASLTDDLEDLLALLSLLDENVGVSNTNMHLRASLGKGSLVMVQNPGGDWRWGVEGTGSMWFTESRVYRQDRDGDWAPAMFALSNELQQVYGLRETASEHDTIHAQKPAADSKRLIWVTAGAIKQEGGRQTSPLASARYRVIAPSEALQAQGWHSEIVNEELSQVMGGWGGAVPKMGDTVIISKVFGDQALRLAQDAKTRGARLIADFCDNFLDHPKRGPLQHSLLRMADQVVAATDGMAHAIKKHGYRVDAVISDPVEMPRGEPKFAPAGTLKLLWFGHAVNLDTLKPLLPHLAQLAKRQPLALNVVTLLPNGKVDLDKLVPDGLSVTYTPWSVEATREAIADCDIVVIPVLASQYKVAKSPNRLLEPLRAGRMVVAGPLPAYQPFADSAWIGENLIEGLQWALDNPQEVLKRIQQGQDDIQAFFTVEAIAKAWGEVFEASPVAAGAATAPQPAACEQGSLGDSPWFDAAWYQAQHPTLSSAQEAEAHFMAQGGNVAVQPSPLFDPREAARLFGVADWTAPAMLERYRGKFPPVQAQAAAQLRKVAVFTAIFGGYDDPPRVENPDPAIDYLLFTDQFEGEPPAPWQVRLLPRTFDDPQVDARRVKVLSHLFLPEYDAAVWMDGNVTALHVTADNIRRILSHAPIALCRHQFRGCIYDESVQILKTAKDATAPVMRQVRYYQSLGFPRGFGLHATMFLVRNHRDVATRKFNARWWEILSAHSKRDQLSFDFVRWEQGAQVLSMPLNCRENTLFQWGTTKDKGHKGQVRRSDESMRRAFAGVGDHQFEQPYDAACERWHAPFLLQLREYNARLAAAEVVPAHDNPLYLKGEQHFRYALPDPRQGQLREQFLALVGESRHVADIGFDTGHAALLALNYSGAHYTLFPDTSLFCAHRKAALADLQGTANGRLRVQEQAGWEPLQGVDAIYLNGALPAQTFDIALQGILAQAGAVTRLLVSSLRDKANIKALEKRLKEAGCQWNGLGGGTYMAVMHGAGHAKPVTTASAETPY